MRKEKGRRDSGEKFIVKDDLQKSLSQKSDLQLHDFTKYKPHKKQSTILSFLKGKKETKNPSTNPNKGQISF
ncbi:hypothetical protein [Myroides odoratus]|uniref:Uncharacterized protein n=1 Tax=Myroides odoratus TaxID=256 RepID=A0A9Q6Z8V0_MYROD|nr:hypothetical protein [Myroides odoratus]QQT98814.1 hypothetical protein I6I88_11365 [Myroides odoratus]